MAYTVEDPRFLPGNISGGGIEHTQNGRIVDTRYSVAMDYVDACLIEHPTPGHPMYALVLAGVISGTKERARCLYLFPPDGAGALIDRLVSLAGMIGPDFTERLLDKVQRLRPVQPQPAAPVPAHAQPPQEPSDVTEAPKVPEVETATIPRQQVA